MVDDTRRSLSIDVGAEWDRRYAKSGFAYGTTLTAFLVSAAHHLPKGRIVSLGAGEKRNGI